MSVFLSYRREDSAGYAGRLCEHRGSVFGPDRVFIDVQDIAPGQDFADAIETTIAACQAMVVVIGPRWIADLNQRSGQEDFVRHERGRPGIDISGVWIAEMQKANQRPFRVRLDLAGEVGSLTGSASTLPATAPFREARCKETG